MCSMLTTTGQPLSTRSVGREPQTYLEAPESASPASVSQCFPRACVCSSVCSEMSHIVPPLCWFTHAGGLLGEIGVPGIWPGAVGALG